MGVHTTSYSHDVRKTIPDDGNWVDVGVDILNLRDTSGLNLTGATVPTVAIGTAIGAGVVPEATWVASGTSGTSVKALAYIPVPRSLSTKYPNPATKKPGTGWKIDVQVSQTSAGTPDANTTFSVRPCAISRGGVAKSWTAKVASGIGPSATGSKTGLYTFDFTGVLDVGGNDLEPGDSMYLWIYPSAAHAADPIIVTHISAAFRCNPAFTDTSAR